MLVPSNLNNLNHSCNRTRRNVKTSNERSKAVNSSLNTQWATVQCSETLAALSVHYNELVWPDMANWGLANFRHKPFHGNLVINTVTWLCVCWEHTMSRPAEKQRNHTWKTLNYQTTVQRTFSWDSGWEIKWSAAGLTFLFQVNLDGDEVFKEHIVDVGVILLEEMFEFSRLCIFYKNKKQWIN